MTRGNAGNARNSARNSMEKTRIRDRMREIFTLFAFVVLSALVSLIVMDILVLPITLFAVAKKDLFNFIVRDLFRAFIIAILLLLIVRRIFTLQKDGLTRREIIRHILYRPVSALATAFMALLAGAVLIGIIHLLFSYNNYFIYKLIN